MAYLKRLPIDEVKIDKAFVFGLGVDADPADAAIVQAVGTDLSLGLHGQGVDTVA